MKPRLLKSCKYARYKRGKCTGTPRTKKKSITLKPRHAGHRANGFGIGDVINDDDVDDIDDDQVSPLNGNTPTLPRHLPPGHLERSMTTG